MQRGDYWLDDVCARFLGVTGKTYVNSDPFFYGRIERTTDRDLLVTQIACSAGTAHRLPSHVRRWTHDCAVVNVQRGRGAVWHQRGIELRLHAGDVMVTNPDEPYDIATEGDFDLLSFFVPRALLTSHLYPGDPDQPRLLSRDRPTSALASSFATDLGGRFKDLTSAEAQAMVDVLARLVAVAAGAAAPVHGVALRQARLGRAQAHIEQHLGDPGFGPAECALALGISVRALHLAFEPTGESFSQYLQRRRLEKCNAMLRNPALAGRAVSEIAFGCGFGSLAGFYRAFGKAYGAAPSDIRGVPA